MKAISLWQPFATLVAIGAKQIESRSWSTSHRGWLAIHAAKTFPRDAKTLCGLAPFDHALAHWWTDEVLSGRCGWRSIVDVLPRGAIVAVARLYEVCPTSVESPCADSVQPTPWVGRLSLQERAFGDYRPNRYGWFLRDVRRLPKPIPCRGFQRLWELGANLDVEVLQQIKAQLPRVEIR